MEEDSDDSDEEMSWIIMKLWFILNKKGNYQFHQQVTDAVSHFTE